MDLFECYICYETLQDPHFCNKCSKLACKTCIVTAIRRNGSKCGYCRQSLRESDLIKCRWAGEFNEELKKVNKKNADLTYELLLAPAPTVSDNIPGILETLTAYFKTMEGKYKDSQSQLREFKEKYDVMKKEHLESKLELQKSKRDIEEKDARIGQLFLGYLVIVIYIFCSTGAAAAVLAFLTSYL